MTDKGDEECEQIDLCSPTEEQRSTPSLVLKEPYEGGGEATVRALWEAEAAAEAAVLLVAEEVQGGSVRKQPRRAPRTIAGQVRPPPSAPPP